MNRYYLHKIYNGGYKKWGIYDFNQKGSPSVEKVYSAQKNNLKSNIRSLRGTKTEAEQLTKFFNATKGSGRVKQGLTAEQKELIREKIGKHLNITVTETLNVAQEDRNKSAKLKDEVNSKIKEFISASSKESSIPKREVDRMLETITSALASSRTHPKYKEYNDALKKLNQMKSQMEVRGYGAGKKGYIATGKYGEDFINLLNELYSQVTFGALSGKIGDIGELYGAAVAYVFYHKKAKNVNELLEEFLDGFEASGARIVGGDKSASFYEDADKFGPGGVEVRDKDNNLIGYRLNYTQDKVDFEIDVGDGAVKTFSAKNYSDTSMLTILSGNLYPILEENKPMLYHLMNLLTEFEDGYNLTSSSDFKDMYYISKLTIAIKALVGGVRAMDQSNNIIHTSQADYLLVNNNRTGKAAVYSTKEICKKIEDNIDFIKIDPDSLMQSRNPSALNFKQRFSNIHVSLHLSQLKNSLK